MSGILNVLLGNGGGQVVAPLPLTANANGSTVNAACTFQADGSLTFSSAGGSHSAQTNWFLPTTSSIGASYWINFTVTSGSFTTTPGTAGTWISLSGARSFGNVSVGVGVKNGHATFSIASDAAGATIVSTGSADCSCN